MSHTVSSFPITSEQYQWMLKEKKRTGNSFNAIWRGLVQEKVDKDKRKAKRKAK